MAYTRDGLHQTIDEIELAKKNSRSVMRIRNNPRSCSTVRPRRPGGDTSITVLAQRWMVTATVFRANHSGAEGAERPHQFSDNNNKRLPTSMQRNVLTATQVVARNLAILMKRHNLKQLELAKSSGVSQRHISSILHEETECGIEKVNKLARVFGLKGWQLQVPDPPEELLDSDIIGTVVKALAEASPEGRDLIAKNAVREAHYSKLTHQKEFA
jgi:transcriptional regulator with XRE-family HTH domain